MRETQATITQWVEETFGPVSSNARVVARANEEMAEMLKAVTSDDNHSKLAEECADVVICLYRLATRLGVDLHAEIDRKMAVNRARVWALDGSGCGYHVKGGFVMGAQTFDRDIDADQATCDAATPGPWECRSPPSREPAPAPSLVGAKDKFPSAHCYGLNFADEAFIAAAREALPAYIAEVRRLRGENACWCERALTAEAANARLAAENARLSRAIDDALAAGHCSWSGDREGCLIDHCTLGRRDRIELRDENERLRAEIASLRKQLADANEALEAAQEQ